MGHNVPKYSTTEANGCNAHGLVTPKDNQIIFMVKLFRVKLWFLISKFMVVLIIPSFFLLDGVDSTSPAFHPSSLVTVRALLTFLFAKLSPSSSWTE